MLLRIGKSIDQVNILIDKKEHILQSINSDYQINQYLV